MFNMFQTDFCNAKGVQKLSIVEYSRLKWLLVLNMQTMHSYVNMETYPG